MIEWLTQKKGPVRQIWMKGYGNWAIYYREEDELPYEIYESVNGIDIFIAGPFETLEAAKTAYLIIINA